jgi:endonuclease YncB( thermonuclease family)
LNTPELRSKISIEKEYAQKARDKFREMVLDKIVTIKCGDSDKYGRILAKVEIYGIDVASELIRLGLGREYDGGIKEEWSFGTAV